MKRISYALLFLFIMTNKSYVDASAFGGVVLYDYNMTSNQEQDLNWQ